MEYQIEVKPSAAESLASLPKRHQRQIGKRIDQLAKNPRPRGSEKLEGGKDLYRIRSGDYRIIYQIRDDVLFVLVLRIGHRRDVYRNLP